MGVIPASAELCTQIGDDFRLGVEPKSSSGPVGKYNESRASMPGYSPINPLELANWDALISTGENDSFFYTSEWARVLHNTYRHEPFYFCSAEDAKLNALLPVMEVNSRLTGKRGVSLPFTDCCPVKSNSVTEKNALIQTVLEFGRLRGWRFAEFRSGEAINDSTEPSLTFLGHFVDIGRKTDDLFNGLAAAVRRGIRKAQTEALKIEIGNSLEHVRKFYSLHCRTRQRHGVPPQPMAFFENIARDILAAGRGFVAIALVEGRTVAASMFFHYGRRAIYKFGASDFRYQHLRANNLVMWEAIKHCGELGCNVLNLGRTSPGQEGLRRFKLGFGAQEEVLRYYRYNFSKQAFVRGVDLATNRLIAVFRYFPPPLFRLAGRLLYPHLS